jgi:hypothetical protein
LHTSFTVQYCPSEHVAPFVLSVQLVRDTLGSQLRHWLLGSLLFAPRHRPPIKQPVSTVAKQRSLASSQASWVHEVPSSQLRGVLVQWPLPSQASPTVQYKPSAHAAPEDLLLYDVRESAGLHVRHGFAGSSVPVGMQALPITQPLVTPLVQRARDSSQLSAVQARPSLQLRALPTHAPLPLHWSPEVQNMPSEQLVPDALFVNATVDALGTQERQGDVGSSAPGG